MINLTPQQLRKAADIQEKIQSLQKKLNQILGATAEPAPSEAPKKRRMSAAGRRAIAAAAKARWAAIKAKKGKPVQKAKKRKMSAQGLANIRAAQKARWAKIKGK